MWLLKNKNKIITFILTFIVFILIYAFFFYFTQYNTVKGEAYYEPYRTFSGVIIYNKFLDLFYHADHAWLLMSFVSAIFERYIPVFLNIHPQESILLVSRTFLFGFFACFLYALTSAFFKYTNNKKYFPLILILVFVLIIYSLLAIGFFWLFFSDTWFLAYVFQAIFPIILYNMLEYFYVEKSFSFKEISKIQISIMIILGLIVSVGHEYFKFLFLITIPVIYIIHSIVNKQKILKYNYLGIYAAVVLISLLNNIGFNLGYNNWIKAHLYTGTLNDFISYIQVYISYFYKYIISPNLLFYVFIFVMLAAIYKFVPDKEKNKRFIICILSLLFCTLIFFVCCVCVEKNYDGYLNCVLEHYGLRFYLKIVLIVLSLSCFGYLYKNTERIFFYIYVPLIIFMTFLLFNIRSQFSNELERIKVEKIMTYVEEKAFIINNIINRNSTIYCTGYFHISPENIYYYKYYYDVPLEPVFSWVGLCDNDTGKYMECIHKIEEKINYKFKKEELENPDFSTLYDINKKKNIGNY